MAIYHPHVGKHTITLLIKTRWRPTTKAKQLIYKFSAHYASINMVTSSSNLNLRKITK